MVAALDTDRTARGGEKRPDEVGAKTAKPGRAGEMAGAKPPPATHSILTWWKAGEKVWQTPLGSRTKTGSAYRKTL